MKNLKLTNPQEETLVYAINFYLDYIDGVEGTAQETNKLIKVLEKLNAERESC